MYCRVVIPIKDLHVQCTVQVLPCTLVQGEGGRGEGESKNPFVEVTVNSKEENF
jgi:hypothetical protein